MPDPAIPLYESQLLPQLPSFVEWLKARGLIVHTNISEWFLLRYYAPHGQPGCDTIHRKKSGRLTWSPGAIRDWQSFANQDTDWELPQRTYSHTDLLNAFSLLCQTLAQRQALSHNDLTIWWDKAQQLHQALRASNGAQT